jgi:hypothetical protein
MPGSRSLYHPTRPTPQAPDPHTGGRGFGHTLGAIVLVHVDAFAYVIAVE